MASKHTGDMRNALNKPVWSAPVEAGNELGFPATLIGPYNFIDDGSEGNGAYKPGGAWTREPLREPAPLPPPP